MKAQSVGTGPFGGLRENATHAHVSGGEGHAARHPLLRDRTGRRHPLGVCCVRVPTPPTPHPLGRTAERGLSPPPHHHNETGGSAAERTTTTTTTDRPPRPAEYYRARDRDNCVGAALLKWVHYHHHDCRRRRVPTLSVLHRRTIIIVNTIIFFFLFPFLLF